MDDLLSLRTPASHAKPRIGQNVQASKGDRALAHRAVTGLDVRVIFVVHHRPSPNGLQADWAFSYAFAGFLVCFASFETGHPSHLDALDCVVGRIEFFGVVQDPVAHVSEVDGPFGVLRVITHPTGVLGPFADLECEAEGVVLAVAVDREVVLIEGRQFQNHESVLPEASVSLEDLTPHESPGGFEQRGSVLFDHSVDGVFGFDLG